MAEAASESTASTAAGLSLKQDNTSVIATGEALSNFKYFKSDTDIDCSQSNREAIYNTGRQATQLKHKQWVCFAAKNQQGVYNYAKLQVDLSPPALVVTQSQATMTAAGTELTDYQYFKSINEPSCAETDSNASWVAGQSVSGLLNQQWVCFKAKNDLGVFGYAKKQTDLSPPTVHLGLEGRTVTASGANLTDYQYFKASEEPDCRQSSLAYVTGESTTLSDGQWVCFKAKNSLGIFGYAKTRLVLEVVTTTLPASVGGTPESAATGQNAEGLAAGPQSPLNPAGNNFSNSLSTSVGNNSSNIVLLIIAILLPVTITLLSGWRLLVVRSRSVALKSNASADDYNSKIFGSQTVDELYDEILSAQFSELSK